MCKDSIGNDYCITERISIENIRFLLAALIQSLATVMVIGYIALLNFPRRQGGGVTNTDRYDLALKYVILIGFIFILAIFVNIGLLVTVDSKNILQSALSGAGTALAAFVLLIVFLSLYIKSIKD